MSSSRSQRPFPPTQGRPLRALLHMLADETGELAAAADGLQGLVGELMADPPVYRSDAVERAQALDALVQRLKGMEDFLTCLAASALHDLAADTAQAAGAMNLSTQSRRFEAATGSLEAKTKVGEFELF